MAELPPPLPPKEWQSPKSNLMTNTCSHPATPEHLPPPARSHASPVGITTHACPTRIEAPLTTENNPPLPPPRKGLHPRSHPPPVWHKYVGKLNEHILTMIITWIYHQLGSLPKPLQRSWMPFPYPKSLPLLLREVWLMNWPVYLVITTWGKVK